jgi:hypothetical protein
MKEQDRFDSDYVYHFTDTARLPWILESRELRLDHGAIGKYPTKFVWGTTLQNGDRPCASLNGDQKAYRQGWVRLVRFTFASTEFEPWIRIKDHPDWTPELFDRMEATGKKKGGIPKYWMVRTEPLSIAESIDIETKSYRRGRWEPLARLMIVFKVEDHPEVRGIVIDGMAYLSAQVHDVGGIPGAVGYAVRPPQPASLVSSEFADL